MTKRIIVGLLLILSLNVYTETVNKPIDRYDFHLMTSKGEILLYYDNGNLKVKIPLEKGIKSGVANTYYRNGVKKTEREYKDGKVDGLSKFWSEEGVLIGEETVINGLRDGYKKTYYSNGGIKEELLFKEGELLSMKLYLEDGSITLIE